MRVNKRAHPRVNTWLEVSFKSSRELVTSYMSNISKGGMFIQTQEVLELGEVLALTFEVPGQEEIIGSIAGSLKNIIGGYLSFGRVHISARKNKIDSPPKSGLSIKDTSESPGQDFLWHSLHLVGPSPFSE